MGPTPATTLRHQRIAAFQAAMTIIPNIAKYPVSTVKKS